MTEDNSLYWIHDEDDDDPFEHGYIGITSCMKSRFVNHPILNEHVGATIEILYHALSRARVLELEKFYRPKSFIGWNVAPGGGGGVVGRRASEETKAKISAATIGRAKSKEHRRKISQFQRGRSLNEETKAKISQTGKDKSRSLETKRKISQGRLGKSYPHSGVPRSPECRAKISEKRKLRKETEGWKRTMKD